MSSLDLIKSLLCIYENIKTVSKGHKFFLTVALGFAYPDSYIYIRVKMIVVVEFVFFSGVFHFRWTYTSYSLLLSMKSGHLRRKTVE